MSNPLRASVAQVVAKLLAQRETPQDEVPGLVHNVHLALTRLTEPAAAAHAEVAAVLMPAATLEAPPKRPPRQRRAAEIEPPVEQEVAAAVLAPRLVRRAEVVPPSAPPQPVAAIAIPGSVVRGVVKWFDLRTRRGALRLPGSSGDVPVDAALLDEMAIPRLYKGQEVEATTEAGEPPRVVRLALPGGAWQVSSVGGIVHSRQAKPVVVELKREGLRRVAARAEAELLLGPASGRSR